MDEEGIRARFPERTLPVMTPATPATVDELVAAVDEVRRTGLSIDRGESTPGVTCYAAPIYGRGDVLVAAVSISVIDATGSDREPASYGQAVRQAAAEISLALGSQERGR
jgi:IclR family acetate operon transcriptional repressor